jgi:hypothetical protein
MKPLDGLELSAGEDAIKSVGTLESGSSQLVKFRLFVKRDAFEGSHNLNVIEIQGDQRNTNVLSIEVLEKDFKEVELDIGDIESDPTRIKPDDDNVKFDVTLQNLGDGTAKGVKAELVNLPKGVTLSESYSGTSLLGNIEADSTAVASFYIDVDESTLPKEHLAAIRLSYKFKPDEEKDEFVFEEKMLAVRIAVKPIPLYEITDVRLIPEILTAGDEEIVLTMTLKNVGEEEGESVRIKAFGKTEQPIVFDKSSDFIAPNLKPGEEAQGTLQFDLEDTAPVQKYFIDLQIKNVVNDDVITYDKKLEIEVSNPKPNNPWKLVIPVLIVIVAVVGFMIFRRKGKKKRKVKKASGSYGKSYLDD